MVYGGEDCVEYHGPGRKNKEALGIAAACAAAAFIFLVGKTVFREFPYRVQQEILHSAQEMYMPQFSYIKEGPRQGVAAAH